MLARIPSYVWVIIACVLAVGHTLLYYRYMIDDAYITFRFVEQWTDGNGLVYNIGDRVEGYSTFLWIALLAPFSLLGGYLPVVAKGLGATCVVLTVIVVYLFSRRFASDKLYAVWLLVASVPFAMWGMGGLESPLFALLLTLSSYVFLVEEETEAGHWSGLLFALLSLTRPEGLMLATAAVGYRCWRLYQQRRWPTGQDYRRAVWLGGIVGVYFGWRWSYYGYLLPNTIYAKSMGGHPRGFMEGLWYLYQSTQAIGGFFLIGMLALIALLPHPRSMAAAYLGVMVGTYGFFIFISGGDWMPGHRFLLHILPLTYLLLQEGLIRLIDILPLRRYATLLVGLLVFGQVLFLLANSVEVRFIRGLGPPHNIDIPPSTAYLIDNASADDTIAVVDAGRNAFYLPLETQVVDMVGLTDGHIAHQPPRFPGGVFGRGDAFGKWDLDYVLAAKPQYIQMTVLQLSESGHIQTQFTGATLLANDPRFREQYRWAFPVTPSRGDAIFERIADPPSN